MKNIRSGRGRIGLGPKVTTCWRWCSTHLIDGEVLAGKSQAEKVVGVTAEHVRVAAVRQQGVLDEGLVEPGHFLRRPLGLI